jgi:hypothetical protein
LAGGPVENVTLPMTKTVFCSSLLALALVACGGDSGGDGDIIDQDGGGAGSADAGACPGALDLLPAGWTPIASVSAGTITTGVQGDANLLTVDATAGGGASAGQQPFVYLDFSGADPVVVDINDVDAFDADRWDLAFKRFVIRANGGNSGPGGVSVAKVAADSLADVTTVPGASQFLEDRWVSNACTLLTDASGAPLTRFGDWYTVSQGRFLPEPTVYVVTLRDGSHIAVEILSYYGDDANPDTSAVYDLAWKRL